MNTYGFFAIVAAAFAIWAMVNIAQSDMMANEKIIWFILVVFFPVLGPIIYYFIKVR